jgi:hypothetical protein
LGIALPPPVGGVGVGAGVGVGVGVAPGVEPGPDLGVGVALGVEPGVVPGVAACIEELPDPQPQTAKIRITSVNVARAKGRRSRDSSDPKPQFIILTWQLLNSDEARLPRAALPAENIERCSLPQLPMTFTTLALECILLY